MRLVRGRGRIGVIVEEYHVVGRNDEGVRIRCLTRGWTFRADWAMHKSNCGMGIVSES